MPVKFTSLLLLLQLSGCFNTGTCGKVLVWPMEYSHWINLKAILDELVTKGHEVTVLTSTASFFHDPKKQSDIKYAVYPTTFTKNELEIFYTEWVRNWTNASKSRFWTYFPVMEKLLWKYSDVYEKLCKEAVSNKEFMAQLQESRFEVLLADAVGPCGELLAELLKLPLVYSLRFTPGFSFEKHIGGLPFPPSYVPVFMSELSNKMTFLQRVQNMIYRIYFDFCFQTFNEKRWNQFYSEVLGRPTTLAETMGKAEKWLIRTYWDFEFPYPVLPHFEFVGGLHCKPAKPLPKEMEEFVQSSGENGVVVFTLGSMVSDMSEERANVIASALAQLPQKVLWRFDGKQPSTLGSNTRLYKWIPQNDLLGHPKTRAFVTHGGTNGIYEAIYHGVPMVGIPLFADQPDNIAHLQAKGAAVRVDLQTMTSADLLSALKSVLHDPSYKNNVMWLSTIQHDQPVKPLDKAVFWIEFVMRHKGAKHLRPALYNLNWFQYNSWDVIGFLVACVAFVTFSVLKCCLFCCGVLVTTGKKKKRH